MTAFFQRFMLVLTDPDGSTYDLYNSPQIGDAFLMVSLYAGLSALNSFISAIDITGAFSVGFIAVVGSGLIVYLTWIFLTIMFRLLGTMLGGKGELPNALGFVGLAAAPLVVTTFLSILVTVGGILFMEEDPGEILPMVRLGLTLVGMAWGWPGVLCYFGMKNSEKLDPLKAIVATMILFFGFAAFEIFSSKLF
ncbi:MAG: YIP1 family protein [Ignavibacteriales bacterium]|nr:YIP1 family protein [Ignavibacteriales bacterium]